jgi:hypothetical protein
MNMSVTPLDEALPQQVATPEILQIVPAVGWWLDVPEIDPGTGAVMTNRTRAIAFALCRLHDGTTAIKPISADGLFGECSQLTNESDAGLISKYKKRARATAGADGEDEEEGNSVQKAAEAKAAKPNEMALKHLKTSLGEALQWVSDILDKDPGDELLRQARQQLRWMQGAVGNERRPTMAELAQVTMSATIIPKLDSDDAYLAAMLGEIENLYREL